ncbi:MAG: hypothetical protein K2G03_07310, partial [Bacilli bacterium]|nr:hypothetical protein [Bacilli bacterium]
KMEYIMLSADGDVLLYKVTKKVLSNFDDLLEQFFNTKTTNCYDEQLFVAFVRKEYGNNSMKFVKNLGIFTNNTIPKEYVGIKWFNF